MTNTNAMSFYPPINLDVVYRFGLSLLLASAVTFGLFSLMRYLINTEFVEPEPSITIDFNSVYYKEIVIEDEVEEELELIEAADPPKTPSVPQNSETEIAGTFPRESFSSNPNPTGLGGLDITSGVPIRLVAVAPAYPPGPLARNVEGYVDVQYDIEANGVTSNIQILAFEPSKVFNRAVIKAVSKWRYRPKLKDGKAVPVRHIVERVRFDIED